MWVKTDSSQAGGRGARQRLRRLLDRRVLVVLLYTAVVFLAGILAHRSGLVRSALAPVRQLDLIPRRLAALRERPERLDIDIKLQDYLQLAQKRDEALTARLLAASADDFVPATIRLGGESIGVKLRLKGDLQDHWQGEKWSLRIRVRGDRAIWGMKEFSIQDPSTRSFLDEWVYHENLRREGLPALRYRFVEVSINGEGKGVYAVEEHFGKELIERAELREGPIVRFNEDASWAEVRDQGFLTYRQPNVLSGSGAYLASGIDAFNSGSWTAVEGRRDQYRRAVGMLEGFRRGELRPSEVFEVPKLAVLLAVSDLHGAAHATSWRNCRFYYNPVTSRLEPIGFDGTSNPPPVRGIVPMWPALIRQAGFYRQHYYDTLFGDLEVFAAYVGALEKVAEPSYLDGLLADLEGDLRRNERILRRDYPEYEYSAASLRENQRYLRAVLDPPKAIHAHLAAADGDSIELEVGNLQILPVELLDLSVEGAEASPAEKTILPGRPFDSLVDYRPVRFPRLRGSQRSDAPEASTMAIAYRLLGSERIRTEPVLPWQPYRADAAPGHAQLAPDFRDREFIAVDEGERRIRVLPGRWRIDRDLVLPAGYRVTVEAGTALELAESASVVSRSPLELRGDAEAPVVLWAGEAGGGGLFVLQTGEASILDHAVFDGLSAPSDPAANLTGAVTFYEAPVSIRDCRFQNARAEDALNVIRSRFEISTTTFVGGTSDAFDADFSDGKIFDTDFESPTNDGIDISGSVVNVAEVRVRGAGDKGLSAGEASRLTGGGVEVARSRVALASKDLSQMVLFGVRVESAEIGVAAYQKKPEFGPGAVEIEQLTLRDVAEPFWIEERSSVTVDGKTSEGTRTNPRPVFYPND